jgi:hypothetical protein
MFVLTFLLCCAPRDADVRPDSGPADCSDPSAVAPATEGTFTADFLLSADGAGEDRLDAFSVAANAVALTLDGAEHRGLAYQHHDWESAGYVLFDLLTVAGDGSDLAVTYLYAQGAEVPYAYTESFTHPMDWEVTSGEVAWEPGEVPVEASIPALRAMPPGWVSGISIEGQDLWLAGSEGGIALAGEDWRLLPFAAVDCTDCPGGPWLELHALMVGECAACFGIVYLFPEDPGYAQLSYGLCLPDLTTQDDTFEVSWSGSLATARAARPAGPWPGRPPPPRP